MALMNTDTRWGWPARAFHWVMAILILFMLGLGLYTANIVESLSERFELVQLHKSFGFVVFVLAVLRLLWRFCNRRNPALPANMKLWERMAAHVSHVGLYLLMFAMPLTGWLMASASRAKEDLGVRNMVFGLFEMPDPIVPGDNALAETFGAIHFYLAIALMVLLAVHIGASLKHHLVLRDDVLRRMSTLR